jgi:hypothetical protein
VYGKEAKANRTLPRWKTRSGVEEADASTDSGGGSLVTTSGTGLFPVPRRADEQPSNVGLPLLRGAIVVADAPASQSTRRLQCEAARPPGERLASPPTHPSSLAGGTLCRQPSKVGARCPNRARRDLCGGAQQWASLPRPKQTVMALNVTPEHESHAGFPHPPRPSRFAYGQNGRPDPNVRALHRRQSSGQGASRPKAMPGRWRRIRIRCGRTGRQAVDARSPRFSRCRQSKALSLSRADVSGLVPSWPSQILPG